MNDDTSIVKIIAEERISFGINPEVATVTTVAEVREVYNEVDCRLIAKEVSQRLIKMVLGRHTVPFHISFLTLNVKALMFSHFSDGHHIT